jgi:mono/diheme cytochrome c family protein
MYFRCLNLIRTVFVAGLFSFVASSTWADGNKGASPPTLYTQECGSCHLAFPPNLLPKISWQRVMKGLDKHYGSDASLDVATQNQIDTWLQTYGGQGKRAREEPPQDRITRATWFERKHREVSAATFKRTAIKSPSNCSACHRDAAQGDFEEDRVRIPK